MNYLTERQLNIKRIFKLLYSILVICTILELILFGFSESNLCIIFMDFVGLFICQQYILTSKNLYYYPVSTVAISLYVFFFLFAPLPATLIELKPVSFNLRIPEITISMILLLEVVLLITHLIYKLTAGRTNVVRNFLSKTQFYTSFTTSELWFMIIVSLILHAYLILTIGLYTNEEENVYQSLPTWLYAINSIFGGKYNLLLIFYFSSLGLIGNESFKKHHFVIWLIAIILFFIGIGTNMRTAAVSAIAAGAFMMIVDILFYRDIKTIDKRKTIYMGLVAVAFMSIFLPISKAMVNVRGERTGVSGLDMIEMTLNNKESSSNEAKVHAITPEYDETYLSNDLLGRFCSLKIHDETIYRALSIDYPSGRLQQRLLDEMSNTIPKVINNNRKSLKGTLTDVLAVESNGANVVGGAKIGTLQGLGLALFGWYFIPIIMIFYVPIFYLLDSLATYSKDKKIKFSLLFIMNIITYCYWFSDRHYYIWEFTFLLRGFIESVVFTLLSILIIKRLPLLKH